MVSRPDSENVCGVPLISPLRQPFEHFLDAPVGPQRDR